MRIIFRKTNCTLTAANWEIINNNFEYSTIRIYTSNNYYEFNDFETPVKQYIDDTKEKEINLLSVISLKSTLKRNKYRVNNGYLPFLTSEEYKEFYTIESTDSEDQHLLSTDTDYPIVAILKLDIDQNVVIYETNFINLFDIIGLTGGFLVVIGLIIALITQIIGNFIFKKELDRSNVRKNGKWFSYPPIFSHENKEKKIKRKNGAMRIRNFDEEEKKENERMDAYRENGGEIPFPSQNTLKTLEVKSRLTHPPDFRKSLDWVNISQSIQELKQYVAYLLEKDDEAKIDESDRSIDIEDKKQNNGIMLLNPSNQQLAISLSSHIPNPFSRDMKKRIGLQVKDNNHLNIEEEEKINSSSNEIMPEKTRNILFGERKTKIFSLNKEKKDLTQEEKEGLELRSIHNSVNP